MNPDFPLKFPQAFTYQTRLTLFESDFIVREQTSGNSLYTIFGECKLCLYILKVIQLMRPSEWQPMLVCCRKAATIIPLCLQVACKHAKGIVRRLQGDETPEWSQRKPQSPLGLPSTFYWRSSAARSILSLHLGRSEPPHLARLHRQTSGTSI